MISSKEFHGKNFKNIFLFLLSEKSQNLGIVQSGKTQFLCSDFMLKKLFHIFLLTTFSAHGSETFSLPRDSTIMLREVSVSAVKHLDGSRADGSETKISRTSIERLNIVSAKDAALIVPNLFIPDYGSRITSSIYVRGIGTRIDQPAVGMTIDNIPILNKDNYDFDIPDIERITVSRGPQSTMYGRNTMGGLIDIRTLSPLSYQGTRLLAEYGSANSVKAGISHYCKPSPKFGIGASLYFYRTDGVFKNLFNNENCDKEKNGRLMVKTAWLPAERLSIENAASISLVRQGGYPYEFAETQEINYNDTCFYRRTSILDGLTIGWSNGRLSATSITSYQYTDDNMTLDQDFLPVSYFTLTQTKKEHAVTQEIILKNTDDNRFKWIGGLFGFYRHTDMDAPVTFKDYGIENLILSKWNEMVSSYPIRWDSDSFLLDSSFSTPNYGASLYGEASCHLGNFKLNAGLRLDYEFIRLRYNSDCSTSYTIYRQNTTDAYRHRDVEIHNKNSLKKDFMQLLPKVSVAFTPNNTLEIYASAAKGYKAGGFNTQMFSDVLQQELMSRMGIGERYDVERVVGYEPEKSWNYEIGIHGKWDDIRLFADIAAFYISCHDQQLTVFPEGDVTGRVMANAGKTRSAGAEISVRYTPVERLDISLGYGYTNAKFVEFDNGKQDYSGNFIPYAPQNTIFATANYALKTNATAMPYITFGARVHGAGKIYWNEENSASQNFYARLDANVRFSFKRFSIDFWAKNITRTQYRTFYFVSIQHEFYQRGKPSTFGATLKISI